MMARRTISFLGVGVSAKQAESARRRLFKAEILCPDKKIIREGDIVYFPIIDSSGLPDILNSIDYKLEVKEFPTKGVKMGLKSIMEREFPRLVNNGLVLKFDQIGDIAVTKIDPEDYNYKVRKKVAEIIISNTPKIKTVLNKLDLVTGRNRIFPIEYLAGENKTYTWHQEYGIMIYCDLQKAYFNPRLAEEHVRVARAIRNGEVILDMFTGVGPFALHCARIKDCDVIAVDINYEAITALSKSIGRNKMIGRIQPLVADSSRVFSNRKYFDRIIMNFPQSSMEYLKKAVGLVRKGGTITFYQFMEKSDNLEQEIHKKLSEILGGKNAYKMVYFKVGREVSPSKVQLNCDIKLSD